MVEVYGELLSGRRSPVDRQQLALVAMASMSAASASVTTSACEPVDHRARLLARAAVRLIDRDVLPVFAFQYFANAAL